MGWALAANSDDDTGLDLRILGPLEVLRDGQTVALGGRRQRAVLARLLVEPAVAVSLDRIVDAVWPEHVPNGGTATVQTYVFHLREALEPTRAKGAPGTVLVTTGNGYRLDPPDGSLDALRFEEAVGRGRQALAAGDGAAASGILSDALALWRGEVLSDLDDLGFVAPVAARLSELRLSATAAWVDAELLCGRHDELEAELGRLVSEHPLREGFHAQRMLALYRSGRQSEALEAYRQVRGLLDEELGVAPGEELRTLHERILRQDPELLARHTSGPHARPVDPPPGADDDGLLPSSPLSATSPPDPPPTDRPRRALRGQRRLAVVLVIGVFAALLAGGTSWIARSGRITALPPNSAGVLTEGGLDGPAVNLGWSPVAMTEGGGDVWVVNQSQGQVVRIDPETHRVVQTVGGVGHEPQAVAAYGADVWVVAGDSTLTRINIDSNTVVDKIEVGIEPAAVVAGPDGVWVANSGDNAVQHIDPRTRRVDEAVPVGNGPDGLALEGTTLWVSNGRSGSVSQLDTKKGTITQEFLVDAGPSGIAVTPTDIWVANELSQSVSRISRATSVVSRVVVGDGPTNVVATGGEVWVSNAFGGSVSRIQLATGAETRLPLESAPRALARVGDQVWAAAGGYSSAIHRGGTLTWTRPAESGELTTLDPAGAYEPQSLQLNRAVYDGLVTFRAAGGRGSQTLVPDLATTLPHPTDGGLTYVFTVRRGVRYSSGATVVASDLARGFKRALLDRGGRPDFFRAVVGAQRCIEDPDFPNLCDLSKGVSADDESGRLTIRLTEPDPELLDKLAFFVVATPPGTPLRDLALNPAPSTGPYVISQATSTRVTLSRNPYFEQWSSSAQPAGYPDSIVLRTAATPEAAVADVVSGAADGTPILGSLAAVVSSHPTLVHRYEEFNTDFVYLNPRVAPFDDIRVRRALNFAVDRRRLVELYGPDSSLASATCQMLPPNFPAYRPYCPYQVGPAEGPYSGADVGMAKQLVNDSATTATPITMFALPGKNLWTRFPAYFAEVLRGLGYTVAVAPLPTVRDFPSYQIFTSSGWLADYPRPSTFYDLFACGGQSFTGYCNPTIDAAARRAHALEASDPSAALSAWAGVDKMVTDDASVVALGNRRGAQIVSQRTGNVQAAFGTGAILSQLWVQ